MRTVAECGDRALCFVSLVFGASCALADAKPLRVCLLSGCTTYHSETSLPPFQKFLEKHYNVRCTRVVRKAADDLPGLEKLGDCDVVLVFIKRMQLRGEQLKRFQRYMTSGKADRGGADRQPRRADVASVWPKCCKQVMRNVREISDRLASASCLNY